MTTHAPPLNTFETMGAKNTKTTAKSLDTGSKTGVIILPNKKYKKFPTALLKTPQQYHKVRSLDLSSNLLQHLNNIDISHFKSLKTFNLSHNRLTSVSSTLSQLNALQNLNVSHNQLIALPALPSKLQKLNVSHNKIVVVDCTVQLSKLKEFDMSYNLIVGIGASMYETCSLEKLERLNISYNQLESLESSIGRLVKLVHLDVTQNRLTDLPMELGKCKTLQTVLVANNALRTVPTSLLTNGALSRLRLEKNEISKDDFLEIEGCDEFMERRRGRIDREIQGGLHETDRSVCGLDENKM